MPRDVEFFVTQSCPHSFSWFIKDTGHCDRPLQDWSRAITSHIYHIPTHFLCWGKNLVRQISILITTSFGSFEQLSWSDHASHPKRLSILYICAQGASPCISARYKEKERSSVRGNSRKQVPNRLQTLLPPETSPDAEAVLAVTRGARQNGASDFLQASAPHLQCMGCQLCQVLGTLGIPNTRSRNRYNAATLAVLQDDYPWFMGEGI